MRILLKLPTFILLSVLFFAGCTDFSWSPPDPGTVMAELSNSEKSLSALIIATKVQGTYNFEVRTFEKQKVLERKSVSAPIGYHEHNISLKWSDDGKTVTATIDHDFGEGNKVYKINLSDKDG